MDQRILVKEVTLNVDDRLSNATILGKDSNWFVDDYRENRTSLFAYYTRIIRWHERTRFTLQNNILSTRILQTAFRGDEGKQSREIDAKLVDFTSCLMWTLTLKSTKIPYRFQQKYSNVCRTFLRTCLSRVCHTKRFEISLTL